MRFARVHTCALCCIRHIVDAWCTGGPLAFVLHARMSIGARGSHAAARLWTEAHAFARYPLRDTPSTYSSSSYAVQAGLIMMPWLRVAHSRPRFATANVDAHTRPCMLITCGAPVYVTPAGNLITTMYAHTHLVLGQSVFGLTHVIPLILVAEPVLEATVREANDKH